MEHIRRDKIVNIPNALTLVRIALLPVVVWRFQIGDSVGALLVYLLAMLTDAVDGIIARRFHQVTALGKLLDPVADKLSLVTLIGLFVADVDGGNADAFGCEALHGLQVVRASSCNSDVPAFLYQE